MPKWFKCLVFPVMSLALTGCSVFGVATTEQAKYKVIDQDDQFSVRQYEPVVIAEVTVNDKSYDEASNKGFRMLFDYISGDNVAKQKISMTAPVTSKPQSTKIDMTAPVLINQNQPDQWRIAFVMPSDFTLANTPKPTNDQITIKQRPQMEVAVKRFSGFLDDESITTNTKALEKWMKSKELKASGAPVVAGYNPPWTLPFLRRNEIQIPIQ